MKLLLLISLLIVGFGQTVHAQSSPDLNHPSSSTATLISAKSVPVSSQDDPTAKALEQAVNRLAVAEEKNRLLEEQLKAKDDRIAAKDDRILNLQERITLMQQNRGDLNTVVSGDARMLASCENTLAAANAEIHRLRYPGFFRSLFDVKTITGAAGGYFIGKVGP